MTRLRVRALVLIAVSAVLLAGCPNDDSAPPRPGPKIVISPQPLDAIAYRDGEQPWQVPAFKDGMYTFEVKGPRFTLVLRCGSLGLGEVIHALDTEFDTIRVPCGDPLASFGVPATLHPRQGSIRGVGPDAHVTVSFGMHQTEFPAAVTGATFEIALRPGAHDLVAVAQEADGRARVIVRHNVEGAGSEPLDLDFESVESLTPRSYPVTVPAVGRGEQVQTGVALTTWRGARGELVSPMTGSLPVLMGGGLSPDDTQEAFIRTAATATIQLRGFSQEFALPSGVNLVLPEPLTGTTAMLAASTPMVRPRVIFQPIPGTLFYQLLIFQPVLQPGAQDGLAWVVNTSARWLGAGNSIELPDLSEAPGFPANLGPSPRGALQLEVTAISSDRSIGAILDGRDPPGPGETTAFAKTVLSLTQQP